MLYKETPFLEKKKTKKESSRRNRWELLSQSILSKKKKKWVPLQIQGTATFVPAQPSNNPWPLFTVSLRSNVVIKFSMRKISQQR